MKARAKNQKIRVSSRHIKVTNYDDDEVCDKYSKQMRESEGFDIDVYVYGCDMIVPMFDDTRPVTAKTYRMLSNCSSISLDVYNLREGTDYTLTRVLKACAQVVCGEMLFITFEAINSKDHPGVFQAKVYVPPMDEPMEVELVRPKAMDQMASDKLLLNDLFKTPCDSVEDDFLWELYLEQINESEGFDIDVYHTDDCGIVTPMFDDDSPVSAKAYHMLSNCSRIAVDAYNVREGTDYTLTRVVKACTQVLGGQMFFITFEAINSKDHPQVFQAKVYDPLIEAKKVLLVRPKAMDGMPSHKLLFNDLFKLPCDSHQDDMPLEMYLKQIKESEGFDIDVYHTDCCGIIIPLSDDLMVRPRIYFTLYTCSRIAVDAYNQREGTDYTRTQLIKGCTEVLGGLMFFITFRATNSKDHVQVFQAKVYDPVREAKELLLVRPKA